MSVSERVETQSGGVASSLERRRDAHVDYPIAHQLRGDRICGRFNPLSGRRSHTQAQPLPGHRDAVGDRALPEGQTAVSHRTDTQVVGDGSRLKVVNSCVFPPAPAQRVVAVPLQDEPRRFDGDAARDGIEGSSKCCTGTVARISAQGRTERHRRPRPYARPAGRAPTIGPAAVAFAHRNNLLVVQTAPMLLHGAALDHQHSRHARCRHVQNEEKKS
jgi:hypothetical protein